MENLDDFKPTLTITEEAKTYLSETAKWAKFLGIVGFIITGLIVILALFMGTIFAAIPGLSDNAQIGMLGGGITVFYLIFAAIHFMPCFYLYRFATKTKMALINDDADMLTDALVNQKSMFKFMGIFTIIILGLYAFIFVLVIVGGGVAALSGGQ